MHLVHANKDNEYTVISLLGVEGEEAEFNEFLNVFLPLKPGEKKIISDTPDLTTLFPEDTSYFSYAGSLTTPPCTEHVNWIIFKDQFTISEKAITFLKKNMPVNNYRNEQPLNGRIVKLIPPF